jgi:hypothetical protein
MHDQNITHLDHLLRLYAEPQLLREASFYFCRSIGGSPPEDPTRPAWFLAAVQSSSDSRDERASSDEAWLNSDYSPNSAAQKWLNSNFLAPGQRKLPCKFHGPVYQGALIILQTTCCWRKHEGYQSYLVVVFRNDPQIGGLELHCHNALHSDDDFGTHQQCFIYLLPPQKCCASLRFQNSGVIDIYPLGQLFVRPRG